MSTHPLDPGPPPVAAASALEDMVDARTMVLRLVLAVRRAGREDGESEEAAIEAAIDRLSNWGIDPGIEEHRAARIAALKTHGITGGGE